MILSKQPLTIADVKEYVKDLELTENLKAYLKEFSKISKDKSDKIRESIKALNNPKIKDEHSVKIIDFLPKDSEDINKILLNAGLNEEEARAILEIVKNN